MRGLSFVSLIALVAAALSPTQQRPVASPQHAVAHINHVGQSFATSTNWAGWADVGGRYTSVFASWRQPAVHCLLLGTAYSSFWVGLDGAGSPTVEQTGTEADCDLLGNASYSGWFEFYPAPPVYYADPVVPGDVMQASVTYRGSSRYTVALRNVTRGWLRVRTATVPGGRNRSAEVIAEAPSDGSGNVLPLANFGTAAFSGATVNGVPLGSVRTPVKLTMIDGGQVKASASALSRGSAFTVTWQGG